VNLLWRNQIQKAWAPVHDDLAKFLKYGTSKQKLILLPRNHLKSAIVTQAWTIQQVLTNPNLRVLISCNTWENSRKFLGAIQKYLVLSPLNIFYGDFVSPHWNQDECTIRQRKQILVAPSWATTGTEKQQTSQHYDLIVHDDLVDEENSRTPELREKTKQVYRNSWDLLEPGGRMVVMGTRKHQDDLYSEILDQPGWDQMVRQCYTDHTRTSVLFPEKFTLESLDNLRKIKGSYFFAAEYLNNPIDEEAADFKADWIKTYAAGTPHPSTLYLTCDPALSLSRDADYTAMVVAGQFADKRIRVVDYIHRRMVPSDLVDAIFELVQKWGLHRVGIETFAFQKTLKYEIQRQQRERGIFFSIDELGKRHTGRGEPILSKEARIRRLQPYFEQGLVEIRSDMQALKDELLAFPRGKHDDLIDAFSYQLDFLVPSTAGERKDPGLKEGTMGWWVKNKMPEAKLSIYDRFFSDLGLR
jgi:predicted phage terminase large subunit-like protein